MLDGGKDYLTIYHGSTAPIELPRIIKSGRNLDFGEGFYATSNKLQAIRWAEIVAKRRKSDVQFITEFEFDIVAAKRELAVITFDSPDDDWLDFVCLNRSGQMHQESYDIVIGPVANDQVYTVVALYEQGVLSKEAAIIEMKVRELYDQVLFHTEKSLNFCKYLRHSQLGGL